MKSKLDERWPHGIEPIEFELQGLMRELGNAIDDAVNDGQGFEGTTGFLLMIYDETGCNFLTNRPRANVMETLREMLEKYDQEPDTVGRA